MSVSDILELAYLWGGSAGYPAGATLGPRVRDDYELVWIVAGHATYVLDGRELDASPGTVILARPGFTEAYCWDPDRPTRHAFLHFAVSDLPDDWPEPERWPVLRRMPPGDTVRPLFQRVLDEWCDGSRRRERPTLRGSRIVEALLDGYLTEPSATTRAEALPEAVRRSIEWVTRALADEPARRVTLSDLAAAAAVTPKHLCRLFAASLGRSPLTIVRSLRLERSLVLLARTNLSVQEVAALSGFGSPFHFSRCFRAAYGRPPSELRRALLAGDVPPSIGGTQVR